MRKGKARSKKSRPRKVEKLTVSPKACALKNPKRLMAERKGVASVHPKKVIQVLPRLAVASAKVRSGKKATAAKDNIFKKRSPDGKPVRFEESDADLLERPPTDEELERLEATEPLTDEDKARTEATAEEVQSDQLKRRERNEKLKDLIKLAETQGYLTFDDINDALPDSVIKAEDLESYLALLRGMDIEIIDASSDRKSVV